MTLAAPTTERRAHRRVPLQIEVRVTSGQGTCLTRARDVSVGGVGIALLNGVRRGDQLDMELSLGLGRTFVARAEVTRLGDSDLGVRFLQLDQRALVELVGYVARAS